jgi:hypothetical protein
MGGSEKTRWRSLIDSQAIDGGSPSLNYIDIYCVEYDQDNGIISDLDTMDVNGWQKRLLEKIICYTPRRRAVHQLLVSSTGRI